MNILRKMIGEKFDKKAFRAYRKRGEALPEEYRVVWSEMERYIWGFGSLDGSFDMLSEIVTLFETGAAEGKYVLDITGRDVIEFCDGLIQEWKSRTWQGQMREKINARIHKALEELKQSGE